MAAELTDDQVNQIRSKLAAGRKLVAVKMYKDWTGSSLVDAKNSVERLQAGNQMGVAEFGNELESDQLDKILDAIEQGRKLNAVKLYKESAGASLMDAKEFIERLMKELEIEDPGSVPGAQGCASMVLLLVFALLLISAAALPLACFKFVSRVTE